MTSTANLFELHYYFNNDSHLINASLRNKCEAEVLAIIYETASILSIDFSMFSSIPSEGGFRDFWKAMGSNNNQITILLVIVTIVLSRIPTSDPEMDSLDKDLKKLSIEEKKLNIEKLKIELKERSFLDLNKKNVNKAANLIDSNIKIVKRRSNLYNLLSDDKTIEKVGFSISNADTGECLGYEQQILRSNFTKFIMRSNKLRSEIDENALIEIISPVLKEGRFRWKGIYEECVISFDMNDDDFKEDVLLENIAFKHGSYMRCVFKKYREIDEIGDIKITGYSVITVIEVIEENEIYKTKQGIRYQKLKDEKDSQLDFFE